jgi:hypothetical protein
MLLGLFAAFFLDVRLDVMHHPLFLNLFGEKVFEE